MASSTNLDPSPLLPLRSHENEHEVGYKLATKTSAVFSLSTSIVGAGIMGLPATVRIIGLIPGLALIVFVAFLTNASVDFLLKYSNAAKATTYGAVMGDAFGRVGRIMLQVCIVISSFGTLVVYLIIIADVLSGSTYSSVHHTGVLEEWAGGQTWWNRRSIVMLLSTVVVLAPLASFRYIDSLRLSSALSVVLAVFFVIATAIVAIWKIIDGTVGSPKLLPDIHDDNFSVFNCFSVVPVVVTAFICHHCVHPVINELEKSSNSQAIVRTSLALCTVIYLTTSFFGYLLFGDNTLSDVLSNFDVDLGVPYSGMISDFVRVGYAIHLMLVFPLLHFALRLNLDGLIFPRAIPIQQDTQRFLLLTVCIIAVSLLGACFIPDIWDAFQITGATSQVVMGFIFPASLVLRDAHGIATRKERWTACFMVILAVGSSIIALTGDFLQLL